jgi:O-antigen/teichoic acid export membrane protein
LGYYYLTASVLFFVLGVQEQVVLAPYAVYSKRRQGRELAEYLGSSWAHHAALIVLTALVLGMSLSAVWLGGRAELAPPLLALLGGWPLLLLRHGIRRFALVDLQYGAALAVDAAASILQLAALAALVWLGQLTIFSIYGAMAVACAVASAGWYLLARPPVHVIRGRVRDDWRGNWAFGKWALRSFLIGSTVPYIMPWLLDLSMGTAATGVFGACLTLVGVTNIFISAVANVVTPQAASIYVQGGSPALARFLWRAGGFLALSLSVPVVLMAVAGDPIARWVFGESFQGLGGTLTIMAGTALMTGISMVAGNGLWALERPKSNFLADVVCLITTLLASLLLIAPWGVLGAALATLAGALAGVIVRTWILMQALAAGNHPRSEQAHPAG